jgi:hypothetical protein
VGFTNPILGGLGTLIRAAIRSPNYVAGLAGWSINKDGSAEFNNLVSRGDFLSISNFFTPPVQAAAVTSGARNDITGTAALDVESVDAIGRLTRGLIYAPPSPTNAQMNIALEFIGSLISQIVLAQQKITLSGSPATATVDGANSVITLDVSGNSTITVDNANGFIELNIANTHIVRVDSVNNRILFTTPNLQRLVSGTAVAIPSFMTNTFTTTADNTNRTVAVTFPVAPSAVILMPGLLTGNTVTHLDTVSFNAAGFTYRGVVLPNGGTVTTSATTFTSRYVALF